MKGDQRRYHQILLNFLSNSIKFTSSGKSIRLITTILEVQELNTQSSSLLSANFIEKQVESLRDLKLSHDDKESKKLFIRQMAN